MLCDALDFLATDYWEQRFKQLPVDEMNCRCSAKYQRPFDVSRLGDMTVEFTPGEYKVKYRMTGTEKAREYPLNWHLKVGNDPENLLRIYFFHDDKARKLVDRLSARTPAELYRSVEVNSPTKNHTKKAVCSISALYTAFLFYWYRAFPIYKGGSRRGSNTVRTPLHKNKGKSVAACLKDRTDYAQNPDKTAQGELVSSYACSPLTVGEEFMLTKRLYERSTGRIQKSDVIAYQVRQSFKPGEVTPEEANRIGYEFAERFLKGKYAFIVATHTDQAHIHNHILYNSTALDGTRKFKNFWLSSFAVQRLSNWICLEHQLSVVENQTLPGAAEAHPLPAKREQPGAAVRGHRHHPDEREARRF